MDEPLISMSILTFLNDLEIVTKQNTVNYSITIKLPKEIYKIITHNILEEMREDKRKRKRDKR